jgi:putative restriction endonuclease
MLGLIAITDHDWFEFLRAQGSLDEVNFWRPSDKRIPRQLSPGTPVLFKLKKQYGGQIVGYGIFARHEIAPVWSAWEAFGPKNGAETFKQMKERIERLRRDSRGARDSSGDYEIGCLMLSAPVFFERDEWVRPPAGFPENAVQGKAYGLSTGEGARVWNECRFRGPARSRAADLPDAAAARYAEPVLVRPRLGQGTFRLAVTGAYGRACAITMEHSLPVLEAAHIKPYSEDGAHEVPNGLLLRSDIHRLFDMGYVSVSPDHRFHVSKRLRADFENGRSYYPLDGTSIRLPEDRSEHPDPTLLAWHFESLFRK